ncbi:MAG: hypothetical protein QOG23_3152 [Blastocatellia bacterium]|nr:hypothetical protein [Blastocatellia bacterium]
MDAICERPRCRAVFRIVFAFSTFGFCRLLLPMVKTEPIALTASGAALKGRAIRYEILGMSQTEMSKSFESGLLRCVSIRAGY